MRLSGFNDLFSQDSNFSGEDILYPLSKNDGTNCQWSLISHNFGPILANTNTIDKYVFFRYIGHLLETVKKGKKRFKNKKVFANSGELKIERAVQYLAPLQNQSKFKKINLDLIKRIVTYKKKKKDCKWIAVKTDNQYVEDRKNIEEVSRYVIKELVGNIDFLVIDEAHKGKSSIDENEEQEDCLESIGENDEEKKVCKKYKTRLAALLDDTLDVDSSGRKLCMTATPVELSTDNWIQILKRCGEKKVDQSIFINFHNSLHDFKCNPTNEDNLKSLEGASKNFTNYLQDYVVRRLRCHQDEYNHLVKGFLDCYGDAAHIHRFSKLESIVLPKGSNWQKAIMCCEGIRLAAKGLPGKGNAKYRRMQTRYPAGLIEDPESIEYVDLKTIKDPKKIVEMVASG